MRRMTVSEKHVSSDHDLDHRVAPLSSGSIESPKSSSSRRRQQKQQQQQTETVNCPRCGSTNTKFCYYNNYNQCQPRHLCKACKKHWTVGGSIRNVVAEGSCKNRHARTSKGSCSSSTIVRNRVYVAAENSQDQQFHQERTSDILYQPLFKSSYFIQHNAISSQTVLQRQSRPFSCSSNLGYNGNTYSISGVHDHENFESYNCSAKLNSIESSTITTVTPMESTSIFSDRSWKDPNTSTGLGELQHYWNGIDMETLFLDYVDLPWDDDRDKNQ